MRAWNVASIGRIPFIRVADSVLFLCLLLATGVAALGEPSSEADPGAAPGHSAIIRVEETGSLTRDGIAFSAIGLRYSGSLTRADGTCTEAVLSALSDGRDSDGAFVHLVLLSEEDLDAYVQAPENYFSAIAAILPEGAGSAPGLVFCLFDKFSDLLERTGETDLEAAEPDSKSVMFIRAFMREFLARFAEAKPVWAWQLCESGAADSASATGVAAASAALEEMIRSADSERLMCTSPSLDLDLMAPPPDFDHWILSAGGDPYDLITIRALFPPSYGDEGPGQLTVHESLSRLAESCRKAGRTPLIDARLSADTSHPEVPLYRLPGVCAMINAVQWHAFPFASVWEHVPKGPGAGGDNSSSRIPAAIASANRRFQPGPMPRSIRLGKGHLSGLLVDNESSIGQQGSGLAILCDDRYPGVNLFRDDFIGFNFEHVFNGVTADNFRSSLTPRQEPVELTRRSDNSATIRWPAETSKWGMECSLTYTFCEPDCIDFTFEATPYQDHFRQGYVSCMWASYMTHVRDKRLFFPGESEREKGWLWVGGDPLVEAGNYRTIRGKGQSPLPREKDAACQNTDTSDERFFTMPFYYGLVDGDGDPETRGDLMAYIMMFDQGANIRMGNFSSITKYDGTRAPRSAAWDWQFVIYTPKVGQKYEHRARFLYKPFVSRPDIREEYNRWIRGL